MKNLVLIGFVLYCFVKKKAQNLVPNPSFEDTIDCTNALISNSPPWCSVGNVAFTHLIPCQTDPSFSSPRQFAGWFDSYQLPRTGFAYGSFGTYNENAVDYNYYQHFAQVQLKQNLIINKSYCVTYYVSLFNNDKYSVDRLGAYLSSTPFSCVSTSTTQIKGVYTPQILSPIGLQLDDTLNWMEISGVYTALGNETYLTIGDFLNQNQHTIAKPYPLNVNGVVEYYVDDVSVEEVKLAKCKNDTSICPTDSVLLGNNISEATTYNWLPTNGLSCSTCANPKASPNITTTYTLTKTQCKAITTASITITVKTDCTPKVILSEIPNVFTPNGDGINDTFNFSIVGATNVSFNIYNRWGNLIQTTTLLQPTTILWDGHTTSGEVCSEGVYFYTLNYKLVSGDVITKKGFISLLK